MFAGFVNLGDTLVAPVLTITAAEVPIDADSAPTYAMYDEDGNSIEAGTCTDPNDLDTIDGAYIVSEDILAGDGYAAGKTYFCLVSYEISSNARRQVLTFTVT
tara:strand:+ start:135 stop:443 length:309 start_codon:yes stop_codon:yes gene_type:complete